MERIADIVSRVAGQYERHPYPHVSWFNWPAPALAHPLAYELGQYLRTGRFIVHDKKTRILVAGCGTFEPLVVARAHPKATVVALDLSEKSLRKLQWRARLMGLSARLKTIQADLHDELSPEMGTFDYILCTGVLHHCADPALVLQRLGERLRSDGLMRIMMYPEHSRFWIYELQKYFRHQHVPASRRECLRLLQKLPPDHPLRTTFENYSDARSHVGLVDGFFHAHDAPLSLSSFRAHSESAGLKLLGFGHAWHSQPGAFARAMRQANAPEEYQSRFKTLDAWQRLELLDRLGELAVNPVFWLSPNPLDVSVRAPRQWRLNPLLEKSALAVAAPLLPPDDSKAMDVLVDQYQPSLAQHADEKEIIRLLEGGCLIGTDGSLPPGLAENRCLSTRKPASSPTESEVAFTEFKEEELLTRANFEDRAEMALRSGVALVPSAIRYQMLRQLESALTLWLGPSLNRLEAIDVLSKLIEPRADLKGKVLPWLSLSEILAALRSEKENIELFLTGFPEPPTLEQWRSKLGNADALMCMLSESGAHQWVSRAYLPHPQAPRKA